MKLVIAGSRSITNYAVLRDALIQSGLWAAHKRKIIVLNGLAEGADTLGGLFAEKAGCAVKEYPADWENIKARGAVVKYRRDGKPYNALAGHWRNEKMAAAADGALILWDGKSTGSLDMLHRMLDLGKGENTFLYPTRIGADALDRLQDKCNVLFPNTFQKDVDS